MGNILTFVRNRLSLKILLVMSVSVTVVMGTVICLNTTYQQRQAKESLKTFGRELKFLAYAGLKHPMSVGDSHSVKQQILAIDEISEDIEIAICDSRQRIVFANHEGEINKDISHFIHNKEALALLRALLQTGNSHYEKLFEEEVDGKKYLITIHRMLNNKECHHCHGSSRKNLGGMIVRQSTSKLYASMADLRNRTILISSLGIVAITCLIYLIMTRLVTRPVTDLSEKAGRVARGDLSVYFEVNTEDSIGILGQAFNSMVKTIKDQHDELRAKAVRDPLTGLWNHEEILRILGLELDRAAREGTCVGVLMADLDHFKTVNDTYGHQTGDAVLRLTSRRMTSVIRQYDALGRYGGEEFLCVLPGYDIKSVETLAERLRMSIDGEKMDTPEGMISVSVSLGVSVSSKEKRDDVDSLVKSADTALYLAKGNGRNRVEVSGALCDQ